MRRLLPPLLALALIAGGTGTAVADDIDNVPPTANIEAWREYFVPTPPKWAPQGTVIADTGFRPFPNGFGFYNIGVPDDINHDIFGSPKQPVDLNGWALRELLGPKVCVEEDATGPCTPTLQARRWIESVNAAMGGGHCFGLAATASLLFTRALTPEAYAAGAQQPYDLPLTASISREIARNMASQYATDFSASMAPRAVVETLKTALTPGASPYVLTMFWEYGGHAVTPYALLDRGNGRYDVAVYDNNYPGAARAVHIDTKANTFKYLVGTSPYSPPTIASGAIGLVAVDDIAKVQTCPFCRGTNETTVTIDPVVSNVPLTARLTDLDGEPIPGVKRIRSTNPWKPGGVWSFPTFIVPAGKAFAVRIGAEKRTTNLSVSFLATTGQFSMGAYDVVIPAGEAGAFGVRPRRGDIAYVSDAPELGHLNFVDSLPTSSVQVIARARDGHTPAIVGTMDQQERRVVLESPSRRSSTAEFRAELSFAEEGMPAFYVASAQVPLPAGARLVVDYARWTADHPKALTAYVLHHGHRTPVAVKVTRG